MNITKHALLVEVHWDSDAEHDLRHKLCIGVHEYLWVDSLTLEQLGIVRP